MRGFGESNTRTLASSDLQLKGSNPPQYGKTTAIIDHVTIEHFEANKGKPAEDKYTLWFAGGMDKGLALNVTNERALMAGYGYASNDSPEALTEHYKGERIGIYVVDTDWGPGLRLTCLPRTPAEQAEQSAAPVAEPPREEPPPPGDEHMPPIGAEFEGEDIPF